MEGSGRSRIGGGLSRVGRIVKDRQWKAVKAHLVFEHESILPERPREVLGEVGGELLSVSRVVSVRCYGERVLHPGPNVPEMPRRSRRGAVVRHQVAQVASVRCRWNLLSLSSLLSALLCSRFLSREPPRHSQSRSSNSTVYRTDSCHAVTLLSLATLSPLPSLTHSVAPSNPFQPPFSTIGRLCRPPLPFTAPNNCRSFYHEMWASKPTCGASAARCSKWPPATRLGRRSTLPTSPRCCFISPIPMRRPPSQGKGEQCVYSSIETTHIDYTRVTVQYVHILCTRM